MSDIYDDQQDYEDLDEDPEEQALTPREPALLNSFEMSKFLVDPEAKKKFMHIITKDMILANLGDKDIAEIKINVDLYWSLDQMSKHFEELKTNTDLVLLRVMTILATSRAKGGKAAELMVTNILKQQKTADITREKKGGSLPFLKRARRNY